jgi:hypothetical protein
MIYPIPIPRCHTSLTLNSKRRPVLLGSFFFPSKSDVKQCKANPGLSQKRRSAKVWLFVACLGVERSLLR